MFPPLFRRPRPRTALDRDTTMIAADIDTTLGERPPRKPRLMGAGALLMVLALGAPQALQACNPPPRTARYFLGFDGGSGLGQLQRQVHHRNIAVGYRAGHNFRGRWSGDHNMSCQGPTTQRVVHASGDGRDPEAFWTCAPQGAASGHLMTSMGDIDGYSIVAFAPNRSFSNFKRVCWDVNLTDLGARKWTEVLIVPEAAYRKNRKSLAYNSPDFHAVDGSSHPYPKGSIGFQFVQRVIDLWDGTTERRFDSSNPFTTNDKAKRYKHCLVDNKNGTITVSQERNRTTRRITFRGKFPAKGRVIFSDHNYTPTKDGVPQGFTWHWDSLLVS